MYSADARSVPPPNARPPSMSPDHSAAVSWDKQPYSRDKFDRCADRGRFPSAKRDWALDNRSSSHRSSSAAFSNGGFSGPPSKRRALGFTGRHGPVDNGRHSATGSRPLDASSTKSSSENGKADRDAFSVSAGPSPGYSSSPGTDKLMRDTDGVYFRDTHLSPGDARTASSPCYDPSPRYGSQNSMESFGSRDGERFKSSNSHHAWEFSHKDREFHAWDSSHKDRDYRDRSWGRPDFYRRSGPLPKLDSPREWSLENRELLEGRIDRYGSASNRESAFPDAYKDHSRHEWRSRDRSLYSGLSSRTHSGPRRPYLSETGTVTQRSDGVGTLPSQQDQSSQMQDLNSDEGLTNSKKRPRLTWGQGLAKYEKEKTVEDPTCQKKSGEDNQEGEENCIDDMQGHGKPSENEQCQSKNLVFSNQISDTDTHKDDTQLESCHTPSEKSNTLTNDGNLKVLCEDHADFAKSDSDTGVFKLPVSGLPPDIQSVQDFLQSFSGSSTNISKDVLTQYVEKVEFEIDVLEKEIMKLENEKHVIAEHVELEPDLMTKEITKLDTDVNTAEMRTTEVGTDSSSLALPQMHQGAYIPPVLPETTAVTPLQDHSLSVKDPDNEHNQNVNEMIDTETSVLMEKVSLTPGISAQDATSQTMLVDATQFASEGAGIVIMNSEDNVCSILLSNKEAAQQASNALAHLYYSDCKIFICDKSGILCGPQGTEIWKRNSEVHGKKRKFIQSKILENKRKAKFMEKALVIKYRSKREFWKIGGFYKDQIVDTLWSPEQANSDVYQCPRVSGPSYVEANIQGVNAVKKLLGVLPIKNERSFFRMPPMILGEDQRSVHRFVTKNGLVEDPVAAEQERKIMNPWSAEEKKIFLEKYLLLGKNLRKIASFLEHKTVADCVQFYYLNQKTEEFERVRRKHLLKKRRDARSSALYLATTIPKNRPCEVNDACMEGLSLVAAAAAAMSSSRVRTAVNGSSSKMYRERTINKQASNACSSVGRVGNGETVPKTSRNCGTRTFKGHSEESESQWTDYERELFLRAVPMFGKDFHNISLYIGTKSQGQCKSFFSKARKRLNLDQLVEKYKAAVQVDEQKISMQQGDLKTETIVSTVRYSDEQIKVERSFSDGDVHLTCVEPELQCRTPHKELDNENNIASGPLMPLKQGTPVIHTGVEDVGGDQSSNNLIKREVFVPTLDAAGLSCSNQNLGNSINEALESKTDMRTEPTVLSNVASSTMPSVDQIIMPPPSVSVAAIVPKTPPVSAQVQSVPVKEKGAKGTETRTRREPTSWTQEEKEIFIDILKNYGKNWERLQESLPAKSLTQIKTYFQNSKAKLTLSAEGVINYKGRTTLSKKSDNMDSSSNVNSSGQNAGRRACASVASDDHSLKMGLRMLGSGGNVVGSETVAIINNFERNVLEDSINAQKIFHSIGLAQNSSPSGILPMLNSAVFGPTSAHSAQHSFAHSPAILQSPQPMLPSMVVVQPVQSGAIHQPHQSIVRGHSDILPAPQHLSKQPALQQLQSNQQSCLQAQLQHMSESVLQPSQSQSVQWQQQIPLGVSNVPHSLHHVLTTQPSQSSQSIPSPTLNQLSTTPSGFASAVTKGLSSPKQNPTDIFQSQFYQLDTKSQASQQLQHAVQVQQLQLHWPQQPSQLQQVQSQVLGQVQESQIPLNQQSYALVNEQQQQLVAFKGLMQSNPGAETPKQCDSESQGLAKLQKPVSEDVHASHINTLVGASQVIPDIQARGGDVKLFGQSLLSQPGSYNQQQNGKITSPSNAISAARNIPDASTKVPSNPSNAGHAVIQNVWSTTSMNGCNDMECQGQEATCSKMDIINRGSRDIDVNSTGDASLLNHSHIQENKAYSDELKKLQNGCGQLAEKPDHLHITGGKCRGQELTNVTPNGQPGFMHGLPNVLDAVVAFTKWHLQTSNLSSGRLSDESLSQSWEALQRDPNAFLEVLKANGGSLAHLVSGGTDVLQHLKEGIIYHQSQLAQLHSSGNVMVHPNNFQDSQNQSSFHRSDEPRNVEALDVDRSDIDALHPA